jgi:hypothetical protein
MDWAKRWDTFEAQWQKDLSGTGKKKSQGFPHVFTLEKF